MITAEKFPLARFARSNRGNFFIFKKNYHFSNQKNNFSKKFAKDSACLLRSLALREFTGFNQWEISPFSKIFSIFSQKTRKTLRSSLRSLVICCYCGFLYGILLVFLIFRLFYFETAKFFFKIYIFVVKFVKNFRKFPLKILGQNNFLLGLKFIYF